MTDCIFCKIANGEIPTNMVYEDAVVAAFLDTSQVTRGHTLLVPKKHLQDITEYTTEDASAVFKRLPIIVSGMKKAFQDMQGLNLLNNNGSVAGQSVFHSHIHIIPRYSKSDHIMERFEGSGDDVSSEELAETARLLRQAIEEEI